MGTLLKDLSHKSTWLLFFWVQFGSHRSARTCSNVIDTNAVDGLSSTSPSTWAPSGLLPQRLRSRLLTWRSDRRPRTPSRHFSACPDGSLHWVLMDHYIGSPPDSSSRAPLDLLGPRPLGPTRPCGPSRILRGRATMSWTRITCQRPISFLRVQVDEGQTMVIHRSWF